MIDRRRVALALGSGGARGYAHIGVIQVLDERNCDVVTVAGSSMGALIGGLHAAGKLDEFTDWALTLTQRDVLRLLDVALSASGAIRAEKIFTRVTDLLGDIAIEDLGIPYTAVATDLLARRPVWFQRGPLVDAIRASTAIPGVLPPVMLNGRLLADGGIMDPVPLAPTAAVQCDFSVAVSLGGERGLLAPLLETAEPRPIDEWLERFRRGTSNLLERESVRYLRDRFGSGDGPEAEAPVELGQPDQDEAGPDAGEALPVGLGKLDVMNQALDAMQSVLTRFTLAAHPPDVYVEVSKNACRTVDFHRAGELIELGRALTETALDDAGIEAVPGATYPS